MVYGVVHGRFQPFHLDHLKYALAGLTHCDYLFVGLTNPDSSSCYIHNTDLNRTTDKANPLSYWERSLIVQDCLIEANIDPHRFSVIPFPIDDSYRLKSYVPYDAKFFITIYDDWGRHKHKTLSSYGLDVIILWERETSQKQISGTNIRNLIANNDDKWEQLVSPSCASFLRKYGIDQRIRQGGLQ